MAVFPDLLEWSPTLRRTLWRCRNVGFPRPECRVTAPISAVWWPEEEATEILAWRKKKEGRRRWERQEGILALSWNLRWNGRTPKRDSETSFLGEHRLVSAPLCRCVSPLGGSKTGFGECRSSVAKLAKSERLGGERRQDFAVSSQCDINNGYPRLKAGKDYCWYLKLRFRKCIKCLCSWLACRAGKMNERG